MCKTQNLRLDAGAFFVFRVPCPVFKQSWFTLILNHPLPLTTFSCRGLLVLNCATRTTLQGEQSQPPALSTPLTFYALSFILRLLRHRGIRRRRRGWYRRRWVRCLDRCRNQRDLIAGCQRHRGFRRRGCRCGRRQGGGSLTARLGQSSLKLAGVAVMELALEH